MRTAFAAVVMLQLVNAVSVEPIKDSRVSIYRENATRCIRAPCPSDAASWEGRTDADGRVAVPAEVIRSMRKVGAAGLRGDLDADSGLQVGAGIVELLPARRNAAQTLYRKLVDANTGKAIANAPVRIEYRAVGEWQPASRPLIRQSRSNALGYVALPRDVPEGAKDDVRMSVAGFRPGRLNVHDGGPIVRLKSAAPARGHTR